MSEPGEDCLQAISNALSYSTPKSYDSLLGSSLLLEKALGDQAILISPDVVAQSHPDIITNGGDSEANDVRGAPDNITTQTTH